jgi:Patatin-like phospholipase
VPARLLCDNPTDQRTVCVRQPGTMRRSPLFRPRMHMPMNLSPRVRAIASVAAVQLIGLFAAPAGAQTTVTTAPACVPRVAIVLSGGGAKGIAHIGVLQVLEEEGITPQIVTGTSMGALVGGLYAMGYSPAALDSMVRSFDWPSYFSDASDYQLLGLDRRLNGDRTLLSMSMKNCSFRAKR